MDERSSHGLPPDAAGFVIEMLRDTFENWQSKFLQLLWQVGGLTMLLCVGSPQSKEAEDRLETKLDLVLRKLDPDNAERIIADLDRRFLRHREAER